MIFKNSDKYSLKYVIVWFNRILKYNRLQKKNYEKLFKVIGSIFFISLMLTLNSFKEAKFNSQAVGTSDFKINIISRLLFAISKTVSKL